MIYDISQPVFGCKVYPGDPVPEKTVLNDMGQGDLYNLSAFYMCAHNGTHIDAPLHFIRDGKSVDGILPEKCVGPAYVSAHSGEVSAEDARRILAKAKAACPAAVKRILIKGEATVTSAAAEVFAGAGLFLLGNESQSVGPVDAPMTVHLILLGAETVLLEGIRLAGVPEGVYTLNCLPLNLNGAEGAPCRAILIAPEKDASVSAHCGAQDSSKAGRSL